MEEHESTLRKNNNKIQAIEKKQNDIIYQLEDLQIEEKNRIADQKSFGEKIKASANKLEELERLNPFIENYKVYFGQPGGDFDFAQVSGQQLIEELK